VRLIILLATLAIVLPFVISQATTRFGHAVSERFLERPTNAAAPRYSIPLETEAGKELDADGLSQWVQTNNRSASGYANNVIPLDVVY
jgi:hypothetical protein